MGRHSTLPKGLRGLVAVPRCSDKTTHRADRSANRGTKGCTVPTGRGSPDRSAAAGTDQAAPDRPLDGVIGVGASRQGEYEPHGNYAGGNLSWTPKMRQLAKVEPCP